MLEVDEGSRLGRELISLGSKYSAPAVPSDDQMADSYNLAREGFPFPVRALRNLQLGQARLRLRHNLKYWRREPYLGFGAGAHSFDGSTRWANAHDSAQYVAAMQVGKLSAEQIERVSTQQAHEEEMFLGLRQLAGVNLDQFEPAYAATINAKLSPLEVAGLVERSVPSFASRQKNSAFRTKSS